MKVLGLACLGVLAAAGLYGQQVISAKSGMIHYTIGKVYLDHRLVAPKESEFPEMKDGQVLRSELGRAEVLLTPGVFLRMADSSSIRMLSNKLQDTRLEILGGSALLEIGELGKDQAIVVKLAGKTLEFAKRGLFRIDAEPERVRVYDGSVVVLAGEAPVTVREGRQALLSGVITPEKFDKEAGDEFHRWAARRSGYIATVNVAAARSMQSWGSSWNSSTWLWNPYFGSFTFIPGSGRYITPFGSVFYNPRYYREAPRSSYNDSWAASGGGFGGGGGMRGAANMGGHSSGAVYSGPTSTATSSSTAAAAPSTSGRGADSGTSRESSSGR